jgi:hypothetical protein
MTQHIETGGAIVGAGPVGSFAVFPIIHPDPALHLGYSTTRGAPI